MRRPTIAIVGAGRVGTALAARLAEADYAITEVIARDRPRSLARARQLARKLGANACAATAAKLRANVVWFCVPDGTIASAATGLSTHVWAGKFAFHASGVLSSDELRVLRDRGARIASVHPLMTFVAGWGPETAGVTFAVEGDGEATRVATRIISDLGGNALHVQKRDKAAYHAFATLVCPLLVALLASGEKAGRLAGLSRGEARQAMMPIVRQTLANYQRLGAADSFTGPIIRGDAETVRKHLRSLKRMPAVKRVYVALAEAALEYLPSRNAAELKKLLQVHSANLAEPLRRSKETGKVFL